MSLAGQCSKGVVTIKASFLLSTVLGSKTGLDLVHELAVGVIGPVSSVCLACCLVVHALYWTWPCSCAQTWSALLSWAWPCEGVWQTRWPKAEILTGLYWKPVASWTRFFIIFILTLETLGLTVTCFISSEGLKSLYSSHKVAKMLCYSWACPSWPAQINQVCFHKISKS